MADDVSMELLLDRRQMAALNHVLGETGTDARTVMQARLEGLYRQYVPAQERVRINESIEAQRLQAE